MGLTLVFSPLPETPSAQGPAPPLDVLPVLPPTLPLCGVPGLIALQDGLRTAVPLQFGEGLDFMQQPPILTADYNGPVTIRNLGIVGDFRTVQFHRRDHRRPESVAKETWTRTSKTMIGGVTVSRFTKTWPASVFRQVIRNQLFGYDNPQVFWGTLKTPAPTVSTDPAGTAQQTVDIPIRLRLASKNLPVTTVRKINNRVQYSSHVVNLVVNNFSDARLKTEASEFAFIPAAKLFYQHFPDVYDGLSFVAQRDVIAEYGAFHSIVRNQVAGIGRPLFNNAPTYGSAGKLKAIELYRAAHLATNTVSTHEATHQWADYLGLAEMAGFEPAGHQPEGHLSLVFPRESYVGAVLGGERRVQRVGGDVYRIQATPSPIMQHPLHRYLMGKASAASVPNLVVFERQDLFDLGSSPIPGTRITGGTGIVTMTDIVAKHGQRTGPAQIVWRRATILITVGRLATQKEMDYWNFFAKRVGETANTTSYAGFPSFSKANGGTMRLRTDLDVKGQPKVRQGLQTALRNHSPSDWRGVTFDKPVPSKFTVNRPHTFIGKVTLTDRAYNAILILLETADGAERRIEGVITGGRFSVTGQFPKRGNWSIRVFLFYEGSGPQHHTTGLTGVIVS